MSKKSSVISNKKMDFIDPGRSTGAGMLSSRNNRVGTGNQRSSDLCHRFIEIPASKTQNLRDRYSTPLNHQVSGVSGKTHGNALIKWQDSPKDLPLQQDCSKSEENFKMINFKAP